MMRPQPVSGPDNGPRRHRPEAPALAPPGSARLAAEVANWPWSIDRPWSIDSPARQLNRAQRRGPPRRGNANEVPPTVSSFILLWVTAKALTASRRSNPVIKFEFGPFNPAVIVHRNGGRYGSLDQRFGT